MPPSNRSGLRVLVVDPDPDVRQIFRMLLDHHGYDVMATGDPVTAYVLARVHPPALILGEHPLDLPGGQRLCEALLADRVTRNIPFLALTAHALPAELEDARRTHRRGVVAKPMIPSALLSVIHELASRAAAVVPAECGG